MTMGDGLFELPRGRTGALRAVERADAGGAPVRWSHTPVDSPYRRRRGRDESEALLERGLAASSTIAVIVDEAGRLSYASRAAEQFFAGGEAIEGSLLATWLAAGPRELQEAFSGPHGLLFTLERGTAEPETFHLARHAFERSAHRYTLFMLKPLTEELARQEVEIWKKAIRTLSDEVTNSLAPITSLAHSARLMLANPSTFQQRLGDALDTIEERAVHLKDVLDGYAGFARLAPPARRAVPWADLLAGVQGLYSFRLHDRPPADPGFFDLGQMQQVIINLLKNAAESGSAPNQITLAIRPDADRGGVEIVVRDRGKGMLPDALRSALQPFYATKSPTKKSPTGQGLALCREIVEAHGGRLSLHPRAAGGLTVRCWLPAA